jgi:DNA-binding transcriptional MerR regulator
MSRFEPVDIGEAARRTGVSPAALRLYERRGLLPGVVRSTSGYRQYCREDLRRARLVRRARRAGLSIAQISQALAEDSDATAIRRLLRAYLARLERDARKLARLQRHLQRWLGAGSGPVQVIAPPEAPGH